MNNFLAVQFTKIKVLTRFLLVAIALNSFCLLVVGQTAPPDVPKSAGPVVATQVEPMRSTADETFELNISERHYSQESFAASTAVGIKTAAENLNVEIGVALNSGRIDVLLRNVRGTVRFRGTLSRIFEVLGNRQVSSPPAPSGVSPAPVPAPTP